MIRFRHVGIVVSDLEKSVNFYSNIFNFKIKRKMDESGIFFENLLGQKNIRAPTVKMSDSSDEISLELLHFNPNQNSRTTPPNCTDVGPTHFALTVDNIDSIYNKLVKGNYVTISKPLLSDDKLAKVFFCKDPDGSLIEIVEMQNN